MLATAMTHMMAKPHSPADLPSESGAAVCAPATTAWPSVSVAVAGDVAAPPASSCETVATASWSASMMNAAAMATTARVTNWRRERL